MFSSIILPLIGGLVLLTWGADRLVGGASRVALHFGVSPLVVGLTLVAMGTSAPELAISVASALKGQGDMALGNVVGSNILNLLLVLGVSSLIRPLLTDRQLLIWDVPVMIGLTALTWFFAQTGSKINAYEGLTLLLLLLPYLYSLFYWNKKNKKAVSELLPEDVVGEVENEDADKGPHKRLLFDFVWIFVGIAGLAVGARYFTGGAVGLAQLLEIPEWIIGLTVVALGTSAPELATSVVAGLKGESDMAIGNIVGSCIFNLLWVLGPVAILSGNGLAVEDTALAFDFPFLFMITAAAWPIFASGRRMTRSEGFLYLLCYAYYLTALLVQVKNPFLYTKFQDSLWTTFLPLFAILLMLTARLSPSEKSQISREKDG